MLLKFTAVPPLQSYSNNWKHDGAIAEARSDEAEYLLKTFPKHFSRVESDVTTDTKETEAQLDETINEAPDVTEEAPDVTEEAPEPTRNRAARAPSHKRGNR